jgi:hypothetical protein
MSGVTQKFDLNWKFFTGIYTLQILAFFILSPGFMFAIQKKPIENCPENKKPTWLSHFTHAFVAATLSSLFIMLAVNTDLFKSKKAAVMRAAEYARQFGGYS